MPVDFTGSPVWHDTIVGPANGDKVTGPSVSDMGVLLADRTMWLFGHVVPFYSSADLAVPLTTELITAVDFATIFSDSLVLERDSTVIATMVMPAMIVDVDTTLSLCVYDEANVFVAEGVPTYVPGAGDTDYQSRALQAGFDLPPGEYKFGLRVLQSGAGTWITSADGTVSINALAVGKVGT